MSKKVYESDSKFQQQAWSKTSEQAYSSLFD